MPENDSIPTEEEVAIELRRVIASRRFTANQNSARFLALVVNKAIKGEPIRQAIIGSELFPDKYARNDITDVRVTANKLRRILAEYFEQEGQDDPVVIALPKPPEPGEPKLPEGKAYKPLFTYNHRNAAVADYLKGCSRLWQADPDADLEAMRHFNSAIEREPRYAPAYTAKAELLLRWAIYGGWPYSVHGYGPLTVKQCLAHAARLVRMALKHDPNAWRTHAVSGAIHACHYRWSEAQQCFETALKKNAHDTRYQSWYYAAYLLAIGKTDEAMRIVKARTERSPGDSTARTIYGIFVYADRVDFTLASLVLTNAGSLDDRNWVSALVLGQVFATLADTETALTAIGAPGTPHPWLSARRSLRPLFWGLQMLCLARAGKRKQVTTQLYWAGKGGMLPLQLALAYMGVGETDKALTALSQAISDHYPLMAWLHLWPIFDPLREHPKFQRLLMRMNLPSQKT